MTMLERFKPEDTPLFAPDGPGGDPEFEAALHGVLTEQGLRRRFDIEPIVSMPPEEMSANSASVKFSVPAAPPRPISTAPELLIVIPAPATN